MFGTPYLAALTLLPLAQTPPEDSEVKAGWTALILVLLLGAAVVVISISLSRQLKKVQRAKEAGVYGDEPVTDTEPESRD